MPNNNENATVSFPKKFRQLNKALLLIGRNVQAEIINIYRKKVDEPNKLLTSILGRRNLRNQLAELVLEFIHDCVRIAPPDFRLLLGSRRQRPPYVPRSRGGAARTVAQAVGLRFDEKRLSFVLFPYLQRVLLDTGSGRQRSGTYYPIPAAGFVRSF